MNYWGTAEALIPINLNLIMGDLQYHFIGEYWGTIGDALNARPSKVFAK